MAHIDLIFSDDSSQSNPERPGMNRLVSAGAVHVPGENVNDLEHALEELCQRTGFPSGDEGEFKWSPSRNLWMRDNLIRERRTEFFLEAIRLARGVGSTAMVMIADTQYNPAVNGVASHEMDVTVLLIERIEASLREVGRDGLIVVDTPSGSREQETEFLRDCRRILAEGTRYVDIQRIVANVVSGPSRFMRSLQIADVITGAITANVSGEHRWSPPLLEEIGAMLKRSGYSNIGGSGVKIHPDFKYANLYHWIFGDWDIVRGNTGHMLPLKGFPYNSDPMRP